MEGMGKEKRYFLFLKSVKCKKAQFRAVSQLILSPIVGYLKSRFLQELGYNFLRCTYIVFLFCVVAAY